MSQRCAFVFPDGRPCPGYAWTVQATGEVRGFCLMHDAQAGNEAALGRVRAGGGTRRINPHLNAPRNVRDALAIAAATVGELSQRGGKVRDLLDALGVYAKLAELSDLEERVEQLEEVAKNPGAAPAIRIRVVHDTGTPRAVLEDDDDA
jgi:hypothetical protein